MALNVVGVATFDVMPTMVEGAQQSLRLTAGEVGSLSALIMGGSAVGSMIAKYWVRRLTWPTATRAALYGIVLANWLSIFFHGLAIFFFLQFAVGFFSGSLYSLTLTILSDGEQPDRDFGIVIAAQVAFQAIGLYAGPGLLHLGGIDALLAAFVAISAAGLLIAGRVPVRGRDVPAHVPFKTLLRPGTLIALVGCTFYMLSAGCYWTYIALIGEDAASTKSASPTVSSSASSPVSSAPLAAAWCGDAPAAQCSAHGGHDHGRDCGVPHPGTHQSRRVHRVMLLVQFLVEFLGGLSIRGGQRGRRERPRCRLAPAFHGVGASIGPAVAALFVTPHAYGSVSALTAAGAVLSVLCFVTAAANHRRSRNPG